jgi:hypothetical protein
MISRSISDGPPILSGAFGTSRFVPFIDSKTRFVRSYCNMALAFSIGDVKSIRGRKQFDFVRSCQSRRESQICETGFAKCSRPKCSSDLVGPLRIQVNITPNEKENCNRIKGKTFDSEFISLNASCPKFRISNNNPIPETLLRTRAEAWIA